MRLLEFLQKDEPKNSNMRLYSIDFRLTNSNQEDYDILKKLFDEKRKINTIHSGVTSKYFIRSSLDLEKIKKKIESSNITKNAKFIITDYFNGKITYSRNLPPESIDIIRLINDIYMSE